MQTLLRCSKVWLQEVKQHIMMAWFEMSKETKILLLYFISRLFWVSTLHKLQKHNIFPGYEGKEKPNTIYLWKRFVVCSIAPSKLSSPRKCIRSQNVQNSQNPHPRKFRLHGSLKLFASYLAWIEQNQGLSLYLSCEPSRLCHCSLNAHVHSGAQTELRLLSSYSWSVYLIKIVALICIKEPFCNCSKLAWE